MNIFFHFIQFVNIHLCWLVFRVWFKSGTNKNWCVVCFEFSLKKVLNSNKIRIITNFIRISNYFHQMVIGIINFSSVTKFNLVFCGHFIYSCDKHSTWTFENLNIHPSTNISSDCYTFLLSLIHSKYVSYLQLVKLIWNFFFIICTLLVVWNACCASYRLHLFSFQTKNENIYIRFCRLNDQIQWVCAFCTSMIGWNYS